MTERRLAKRIVGGIYSFAADKLYEPIVVKGTFKAFGLDELVFEQGRKAVEVAGTAPILDMPVGTAFFTTAMALRHPGIVVGADIARGMVLKARSTAREAGTTNLVVVQADAHHLPFPDGTFGAVGCWNGLPVMPGLVETVRELVRVLAPGGVLLASAITVPLGRMLPSRTRSHLPTMLRSVADITNVMRSMGLEVSSTRRTTLAHLIEGTKPG
ncbi:MAG: class I SAM-dependent methyltransferase [Actinomycetota bacterium]